MVSDRAAALGGGAVVLPRTTLFGASEKKLRGYNECFRDAIHFFPAGADRVVPDLYPILLRVLIAVNRTLSVLFLIRG